MCNNYRLEIDLSAIVEDFHQVRIPIRFPEGAPNLAPAPDIKITDIAPIVRAGAEGAELVRRRWSWPSPNGRPVYNFRSDGRTMNSGRCLIPADGFYEFTTPADPKKKRKDKWLFTVAGERLFCIAGLWRRDPAVGEAFTMLTMEPGPDIAPYHDRQIVILDRTAWADWLDPAVPSQAVIKPLPLGTLTVRQVG